MSKEYVRVSLKLPKEEYDDIVKYSNKEKITVTDGFRRSIKVLTFITKLLSVSRLFVEDREGEDIRIREIVFPW